jgi:hypothetical protein
MFSRTALGGWTAVALCTALSAAASNGWGQTVTQRGSAYVRIQPGQRVTAMFRVANASTSPVAAHARVDIPPGWQLLTPERDFTIGPDTAELRLLSVQSPRGALAGRYRVDYRLVDGSSRDSIVVEVEEQRAIEVLLLDARPVAATHRVYEAGFAVRNTGNVAIALRGSAQGPLAKVSQVDTASWLSPPASVRSFSLVVPAEAVKTLVGPQWIGLRVVATNDSTVSMSAGTTVDFVSRSTGTTSRAPTIPATLTMRVEPGSMGRSRAAAELVASGPVSPGGNTTLDLSVRTRGLATSPLFDQDEYRLALRSPSWSLQAGDQYFVQSPLTEAGRLAFGASTEMTRGRFTGRLFDQGSRWDFRTGRARGGSLAVRAGDSSVVNLNVLSQHGDESGDAASLGASVVPFRGAAASLEIGAGQATSQPIARGVAWQVRAKRPLYQVDWTGQETGDAYPARHGRGDQRSLAASAGPDGAWQLRFTQTARALDLSPFRVAYALNEREQAVGFQFASLATLEWRTQDIDAHAAGAVVDESSKSGRLLLYRRFAGFDVSSEAEGGRVTEQSTGDTRPFSHATVHAGWHAPNGALIRIFADRTDRRAYSGRPAEAWTSAGLDAAARFGNTGASVSVINARDGLFARVRYALVDARVDWWTAPSTRVSLRVRNTSFGAFTAGQERHVALEYSTALRLPMLPDRSSGRLSARLFDRETGRGIADALVAVGGRQFLTDDDGRLDVRNLKPGSYPLDVDQESVTGRLVGDGSSAPRVVIRPGKSEFVAVGVARAARIVGRVLMAPALEDSVNQRALGDTIAGNPLRNVLIMARCERQTVRQFTDASGAFAFAGLTPGRCVLSVAAGDLPAFWRMDHDTTELELHPGETATLVLRARPVHRAIRWLEPPE